MGVIIAKKRERIVAFIADFLIYLLIFLLFLFLWGNPNYKSNGYEVTGFPAFILFLIGIMLWPISESIFGQTIGKRIVGIRVLNGKNYKHLSLGQAFIRFIFGYIDIIFFIGLIVASTNKENKRIGDYVAKTVVIDLDKSQIRI
ncbi:RDD family protein [Flavobacterium qiangtangense]|uniref:RDD family protein n=1 Tax=Flavobacterium qiangtangense TaxID=1442595 RepID=A0ABW1PKU3_9FLAO